MPRGIPNKAANTPVLSSGKEFAPADTQAKEVTLDLSNVDMADRGEIIVPAGEDALEKEYAAALAFNEEPVTIRIERGQEEFAPLVQECWVNGEGAEVLQNGKWLKLGFIPIGGPVTTKRKYVEVLARSRTDTYRAAEENPRPGDNEDGWKLRRSTRATAVMSILHDPNPKGHEWFTRLMAER